MSSHFTALKLKIFRGKCFGKFVIQPSDKVAEKFHCTIIPE